MNKDNLIPEAHKLTPEEKSLGGVNSVISRRAKKRALEIAREILSMPVDSGAPKEVEEMSSLKDASEVTLDVLTLILVNMSKKAIQGDLRACRDLLTISGDYSTKQEVKIETEDEYDDVDFSINFFDHDRCEATYLDKDGKRIKTIYGEEALTLYFKMVRNDELKSKPVLKVTVDDGEEVKEHILP